MAELVQIWQIKDSASGPYCAPSAAVPKETYSMCTASYLCIFRSRANPRSAYYGLDVQNEAYTEHVCANPAVKQAKGLHSKKKKKLETPSETNTRAPFI